MKHGRLIGVLGAAVLLVGIPAVHAAVNAGDQVRAKPVSPFYLSQPLPAEAIASAQNLPRNKHGKTYGNAPILATDPVPDLIAVGIHGSGTGYVWAKDFQDPPPPTPGSADFAERASPPPRTIPVYDIDGEKVIGSFTIG